VKSLTEWARDFLALDTLALFVRHCFYYWSMLLDGGEAVEVNNREYEVEAGRFSQVIPACASGSTTYSSLSSFKFSFDFGFCYCFVVTSVLSLHLPLGE
jgi:hypothetical protein